jgi:GNAT superfamily N-acetyltransferase
MATLHVLPNVTWNGRPYALVENVMTHPQHRLKGIGRTVLTAATEAAWAKGAYKIMLMTSRREGARGLYEACGFYGEDNVGMVLRDS